MIRMNHYKSWMRKYIKNVTVLNHPTVKTPYPQAHVFL